MDRNFYYIGIAGFGMINGLFNQALVPFAYLFVKVLAPALLFDINSLALMTASLMASTATIIAGGIPAALYERWIGAKENSTEGSLWIWLAGNRHPHSPRLRKFFRYQVLRIALTVANCRHICVRLFSHSPAHRSADEDSPWSKCVASPTRPYCGPAGSHRWQSSVSWSACRSCRGRRFRPAAS